MLLTLWILAWGNLSWANIISGSVLSMVLLVAIPLGPPAETGRHLSAVGFVKLLGFIGVQLITANVLMAREILSRHSNVQTGVLAYEVKSPSPWTVTLISNIIALTPGTMTVEATDRIIYVHFLLLSDIELARSEIGRIEYYVVGFLGDTTDASVTESTT